jgi:hypothetical protein
VESDTGTNRIKLALVLETRKAEGDCLMDELKTVPDKLVVEDK